MTGIVFIYLTHPDPAAAAVLGRALVESGLAACVNILPGMHSIYRWDGRIETGQETVVIVKTREVLAEAVRIFVQARHPYACPCIAVLPVTGGDPAYLDWIARSAIPCQDTI